jgi:hypothetical protein
MALGLTQPLTEMSTRITSLGGGGKAGRYVGLTILPLPTGDCLEMWEPQSPGIFRACPRLALPLPLTFTIEISLHIVYNLT